MPFAPFIGDYFHLMHNNDRPHIARTVSDYLPMIDVQVLEFFREALTSILLKTFWTIRRSTHVSLIFHKLKRVVIVIWDNIPQERIQNLILSHQKQSLLPIIKLSLTLKTMVWTLSTIIPPRQQHVCIIMSQNKLIIRCCTCLPLSTSTAPYIGGVLQTRVTLKRDVIFHT